MHLQSPFCMLAGSHRICACLHCFSSAVSPAHFPQLKKLLFCTGRAKVCLPRRCQGCVYAQSDQHGGRRCCSCLWPFSGYKWAAEPVIQRWGSSIHAVRWSRLPRGLCMLSSVPFIYFALALCAHAVLKTAQSDMRNYCPVAILSVVLKGNSNKNT